ncbi:hypothetical protein G5C51_06095 [Streptomyces sp. A7024]|uniref:Uncharacterized protein n=1 Tax=Streptomyces coryli TaxID=1128680 RepID=A0A6G4TUC5_9ACTN|nr:hypothetical protein [Streptomyces coryli]
MIPDDAVIGRTGVLTLGTRGAAGAGEVSVRVRGGSEHFLAWSDERRPRPTGCGCRRRRRRCTTGWRWTGC